MNKIDKYIFFEITRGFLLIFFIFLSISWLLQFTRLLSLTNLIQVDIFTILYLSIFLIPNLMLVIIPFVIMFGLIITFFKLHKDKEIISIYTLGLKTKSIKNPLIYFSFIIIIVLISLNFYISPIIYKEYKIKEYEIRNKINFEKIIISNFIEINNKTFLDFKKENNKFKEVFIKFTENKDNIIYAKEAIITQNNDKIIFNLIKGFKITLVEENKIEKLEFENYSLEIINNKFKKYDNFDQNTFHILEDLKNKNYLNIVHKTTDSIIVILIILFFYFNNIKDYKFNIYNLFTYLSYSSILLILNQILKNLEINLIFNFLIIFLFFIVTIIYFIFRVRNVQN